MMPGLPIGTPILCTVGAKRPLTNLLLVGGGVVADATVTAQVQDVAGNGIGAAWACAAVAGNPGVYQGVSAALALTDGTDYDLVVTAVKAAATIWTGRQRLRAGYLRGT